MPIDISAQCKANPLIGAEKSDDCVHFVQKEWQNLLRSYSEQDASKNSFCFSNCFHFANGSNVGSYYSDINAEVTRGCSEAMRQSFVAKRIEDFTAILRGSFSQVVSETPVFLHSGYNPTQIFARARGPVSIKGWEVMGMVTRFGQEYLRVRDPKRPAKNFVEHAGYRPIVVIVLDKLDLKGLMPLAAQWKYSDFRYYQLKKEGVLSPLGENPDRQEHRVNLQTECWWKKVLPLVHSGEGDINDQDAAVLFVRNPSADLFAGSPCGWPSGTILFEKPKKAGEQMVFKNGRYEPQTGGIYGVQAYGQQTLDVGQFLEHHDQEFRRIIQGLEQRYSEATYRYANESDFLVPAEEVTIK